jgi:hypothetical protein
MNEHTPCIEAKELCRTCCVPACPHRSPLVCQCTKYERRGT